MINPLIGIATVQICNLSRSKTDPFRVWADVFIARIHNQLCPVLALLTWLVQRGTNQPGPLFFQSGAPLTRSTFVIRLKQAPESTQPGTRVTVSEVEQLQKWLVGFGYKAAWKVEERSLSALYKAFSHNTGHLGQLNLYNPRDNRIIQPVRAVSTSSSTLLNRSVELIC